MKLLIITWMLAVFPALLAQETQPNKTKHKFELGELKRNMRCYLDMELAEKLNQEEGVRFTHMMAYMDGLIAGVVMADEVLGEERRLMQHMEMPDTKKIYRDFLAHMDRLKNVKDDANGFNYFIYFLMTNYTDRPPAQCPPATHAAESGGR